MTKPFTLCDQILLALYQGSQQDSYRPFSYLLALFPHKTASLRVLVNLLVEKGLINKIEREKKILVTLTELGESRFLPIKSGFGGQGRAWQQHWDGEIHLAILSVPEKERGIRARLRAFLLNHNFRLWQPGIWLSPVKEKRWERELNYSGLKPYLTMVEAVDLKIGAEKDVLVNLVASLWQLDFFKQAYEKYLTQARPFLKMIHFDVERARNLLAIQEFLLVTVAQDPFFPDNLFKLNPLRKKAWQVFQNLSQKKML